MFWTNFDTNLVPMLAKVKVSILLLLMAALSLSLQMIQGRIASITSSHLSLLTIGLSLAIFPIFSSLASGQLLAIFDNTFYKTLLKVIFSLPLFYFTFQSPASKRRLINTNLLALLGLSLIFFYRYHVLQEVREDGRPLLHLNVGDPNFIATIFACFVPLSLYRSIETSKRYGKIYFALLAAVFGLVVLQTSSRMGIIALLLGLGGLWLGVSKQSLFKKMFSLVLCVCIAGAGTYFVSDQGAVIAKRFETINDQSNISRIKTLETGWHVFTRSPIFGVGMESVQKEFAVLTGYNRLRTETMELTVHNSPLKILAEYGIVGLLSLASFWIFIVLHVRNELILRSLVGPFLVSSLCILSLNSLTLPIDLQDWLLMISITIICLCRPLAKEDVQDA